MEAFKDVQDLSQDVINSLMINGEVNLSNVGALQIGSGDKVFRGDQSGIWLGAGKFADAPFSVDMDGNIVATSLVLSGYLEVGEAAADINANSTEVNGAKLQNGTVVAGKLSVTELSAITANAGTVTAGTIQGVLYRSAASGTRVEIQASSAVLKIYDSGGDEVLRLDDNGTDSYVKSYDNRHLALSCNDSSKRVYINSNMDLNGNEVHTVDYMNMVSRSSNAPNNSFFCKSGKPYFTDSSGNGKQLASGTF